MKNLLLLQLITISSICHAQDIQELNQRILKLEIEQREVQLKTDKFHQQFKTGTIFMIAGIATSVAGLIIWDRQKNDNSRDLDPNSTSAKTILLGGLMVTAGVVIQIDSHKYFKKRISIK